MCLYIYTLFVGIYGKEYAICSFDLQLLDYRVIYIVQKFHSQ